MAQKSNQNFLSFTNLTYSEIIKEINNRLKEDARFENFRESSIAQTLIEIFTAATDLTNYYVERRAEESYLDTAQLRSSVILLAKQLGYVVTRPIPAKSAVSMTIKGPLPAGLVEGDQIVLTKYDTNFQHKGFNYILKDTNVYTFTEDDVVEGIGNSDFEKVINVAIANPDSIDLNEQGNVPTSATQDITILEGEISVAEFLATEVDSQKGQLFQTYNIDDKLFSNLYGIEDFSYDLSSGVFDLDQGITKVGIASTQELALSGDNLYEIDRRSLLTSDTVLEGFTSVSADVPQLCMIRIIMNEKVELIFGDGRFAKIGPITDDDNIYVQYLATNGSKPNRVGVVNDKLTTDTVFYSNDNPSGGIDLSNNLEFRLKKNITGGADMESVESIKINAPGIYAGLDRLVNEDDYITYMKSQTSPLNVKNAIAWGEQDEVEKRNLISFSKLFNVVLYSVLGEMYHIPDSGIAQTRYLSATSDDTNLSNVVLEGQDYDIFSPQTYYNLLVTGTSANCGGQGGVVEQLGVVEDLTSDHPVNIFTEKLDKRSQLTLRTIYIPPIIQEFYITGNIYISKLNSQAQTRVKVNKAIYNFLNEKADFNTPVYLSNIVEIIESHSEVIYADIQFTPTPIDTSATTVSGPLSADPNINNATWSTAEQTRIINIFNQSISEYTSAVPEADIRDVNLLNTITSADSLDIGEFSQITLPHDPWINPPTSAATDWFLDVVLHARVRGISERTFYFTLMKNIFNRLRDDSIISTFESSSDFKTLVVKLNNQIKEAIRNGMLDDRGNISNFSLKGEVVKIENLANYRFKS